MLTQSNDSLIPFAPTSRDLRDDSDQLDKAGQTILQLLDSDAGVAEESNRRVLAKPQKLSHQLHAAEDRIANDVYSTGSPAESPFLARCSQSPGSRTRSNRAGRRPGNPPRQC